MLKINHQRNSFTFYNDLDNSLNSNMNIEEKVYSNFLSSVPCAIWFQFKDFPGRTFFRVEAGKPIVRRDY
jgi:hypothetical protein